MVIEPRYLTIGETPNDFLNRVNIIAAFAVLTRPDRARLWVDASAVSNVIAPQPGEYDPRVKSLIGVGPKPMGVIEDPQTAIAALRDKGAKL